MFDSFHVSFVNVEQSEAAERLIRKEAAKLEKFYDRITSCRVAVERTGHRRTGGAFRVRIALAVPGEQLVVNREPGGLEVPELEPAAVTKSLERDAPYKDVAYAVRDAFRTATRRLEDFARRQRGEVKNHAPRERPR